jgi:hypothetical protein
MSIQDDAVSRSKEAVGLLEHRSKRVPKELP